MGSTYGQNLYNFVMIGGYGVTEKNSDGEAIYTNFITGTYWLDWERTAIKDKFSLGIFAGYSKNHGANDVISGAVYGRGLNIDYTYRIAPRFIYGTGRVRFRLEATYDVAAYGTPDEKYKVQDTQDANNIRLLFATTLDF